jgi:hypothetical protein
MAGLGEAFVLTVSPPPNLISPEESRETISPLGLWPKLAHVITMAETRKAGTSGNKIVLRVLNQDSVVLLKDCCP